MIYFEQYLYHDGIYCMLLIFFTFYYVLTDSSLSSLLSPLYSAIGGELHPYCVAERDGPIKEGDAVRLLFQILQGVKYLHDQNIVHLDLKVTFRKFSLRDLQFPLFFPSSLFPFSISSLFLCLAKTKTACQNFCRWKRIRN